MSEIFVSPCPPPTEAERELLVILIEECAEVQHRATKALRFGLADVEPGQDQTNAMRLALKMGDVLEMLEQCARAGIVDWSDIDDGVVRKKERLAKYRQVRP